MASYRKGLPQLSDRIFLTDSGMETAFIFQQGIELPFFAAFDLLKRKGGRKIIKDYYRSHALLARDRGVGFILEAFTWRANRDWGRKLGYDDRSLVAVNRQAIELLAEVRDELETPATPMVVSGCIGPRGDGYSVVGRMSAATAAAYHDLQVKAFAQSEADFVSAFTLNYPEEATGVVLAAKDREIPVVISFTVEVDGRLPSGDRVADAIAEVDGETGSYCSYYMLNCAHPTHFEAVLEADRASLGRLRGIRANASRRSHAELDASTELDDGDPDDLADRYRALRRRDPRFTILGGCCGTDVRHIERIALACISAEAV